MCLTVVDPAVTRLFRDDQAAFAKTLAGLLEKEGVAYRIATYRDAPPVLRIWCGATVETQGHRSADARGFSTGLPPRRNAALPKPA